MPYGLYFAVPVTGCPEFAVSGHVKLDFLTSAGNRKLVRKSSFSTAQGLYETGPSARYFGSALALCLVVLLACLRLRL